MQIKWSSFHTPYKEERVNECVPADAGVYLLWVKLKNAKWRCFYAGRAAHLAKRLLEHLSDNEENNCIKENVSNYVCGFEYATVSEQRDREAIEKFLYDKYKPECNEVDPGGTPIEVNTP
jgi:excinuclease UvrABC nuclease subunit